MQRIFTPITLILFSRNFRMLLLCILVNSVLLAQDSLVKPGQGIVRSITITGNKTTKDFIILREITFKVGDTLSFVDTAAIFAQSEKNLNNTSLFNFVTIAPMTGKADSASHDLAITIDVKERWYTWPAPVFDVAEQNINTWWRNGHNLNRATYGFMITRYNFRGRRETVALIARFGYAKQFGGQYSIPYVNRKQTLGLTFTGLYTRFHEVAYATENNKLLFYKDKDNYIRKEISGSIKAVYRKEIYHRHSLELKFTDLLVSDTVVELASDYFVNEQQRMRYFTLSYQFIRDYRDARFYPLKGHYADFEITRHGLGVLPDEKLNVTFFAVSLRRYFQLADRVYGGAMVRGRWLPGPHPPYYHQRALGFSTYVRGFEYYVVDGQSYVVGKSTLKYQILRPRIFRLKWFPLEKFNTIHLAVYGGIFCDAGYVDDKTSVPTDYNHLGNEWLTGYGAGIDVVTYYDLVFRFEYTFNNLGEGGFFLHMGAPF